MGIEVIEQTKQQDTHEHSEHGPITTAMNTASPGEWAASVWRIRRRALATGRVGGLI
jgi:hypothetical protein